MGKIYTKTGDKGETGLFGGVRVPKDSLRMEVIGSLDEMNAMLGVCRSLGEPDKLKKILHQLQRELFDLGAELSGSKPLLTEDHVTHLENWIDEMDAELDPLQNFILPGGGKLGSTLHLARTICRRAERKLVSLSQKEDVSEVVMKYVNRLSDLLFMMARYANKLEGVDEEQWSGLT